MNLIKIGWLGLGRMGIPMCKQLINAGYPISAYNRNKDKATALASTDVHICDTPAQVIQDTDLVFVMVSDDKAIHELFNGENGLLSANVAGKVIINMSTVSPDISRQMALACSQQGNHYLDAPVSGSVKQAEDGQLIIMVGGDESVFEKVRPVLEKMGKLAMRVGDHGAGNIAKLAVNTLLAIHSQALAETVLLAEKNDIAVNDLLTIINNGAMGNVYMKIKGAAIAGNNYTAAFALKHIAKDLRLAKNIGLDTPLGDTTFQTYQNAEAAFGEEDIIAIMKQLKTNS